MNKIIFFLMLWHVLFFVLIMDTIEAQGVRLIVDSSSFEMLSGRDPFTPQVPQDEIQAQPIKPIEIQRPVVPPPPPKPVEPPALMPRDIVRPPALEEVLPSLNISGVIWNTDRPQAIINGQIAGIGDTVSGVKIVDIQKTGITVLFHEKRSTLEVAP